MELKSVNWIITDVCNGRCVHCDMWEPAHRRVDRSLTEIAKILSDDAIRKGYEAYGKEFDISFAGGEPFVREDLQSIIDLVEKKYPGSFKCITTNGLLKDRILSFVENNQKLSFKLNISIDGLEETNDVMRGKGAFRKAVTLIRTIKKKFPAQAVEIKLAVTPYNFDQILKVYWLAVKLGCDFSFKPVEDLPNFTNSRKPLKVSYSKEQLCIIRNQCFKMSDIMYRQGNFRKAKFYQDIPFYLADKKKPKFCSVLNDHLTIMPGGEAFFCVKEPSPGVMLKQSLVSVKKSYDPETFQCQSCMLLCGVYKDYTKQSYRRVVANVEAINRCNLKCSFCTQKGFDAFEAEVMTLEKFQNLIQNHSELTHVSFLGGESFMNRELFDFMDYLDRQGKTYEITSNGTMLDQRNIDRLKTCIGLKTMLFSLDGLEEMHDKERGRGTFRKCVQAIEMMKDYFAVGVCSVYKADNHDDIIQLNRLLGDMGIKDHRIIYGMSHTRDMIEKSVRMQPDLEFQGPRFESQSEDYQKTIEFFQSLEEISFKNQIQISYVPELFRTQTRLFLDERLVQEGQAQCSQLKQLRFDSSGERIVCEFIRNSFDDQSVSLLKENLLPLCEKCCKLQAVEV